MLVAVMIVMVIGNLLAQTAAQKIPFKECYPACLVECKAGSKFPKYLKCPFTCTKECLQQPSPPSVSSNNIDESDYFCKLGCATYHCVSLSSIQNPSKFILLLNNFYIVNLTHNGVYKSMTIYI